MKARQYPSTPFSSRQRSHTYDADRRILMMMAFFHLLNYTAASYFSAFTTRRKSHRTLTKKGPSVFQFRPVNADISLQQLNMGKSRSGLEQRRESATPTEGGMTLYVKAGPDGTSLGDCPFAHFVRMVLEVKGLEYELKPCVQVTKPDWLLEFYEGKMPALRHRKECYVESDTIAAYLDFFFPKPELTPPHSKEAEVAAAAMEGLFPALAQYLKNTSTGDDIDIEKRKKLCDCLGRLNDHLSLPSRTGPYLVGDGSVIRMGDCKLAPILYHLCNAIPAYKGGVDAIQFLEQDFPAVKAYVDHMSQSDPSFQKTIYPPEVLVWGWGNARNRQ